MTPPESVIRTYYAALDGLRFHDAWDMLSPAVRTALGDFAAWRAGYATTISSHPERIAVELDGQVAAVSHDLAATDRSDCAVVHRRFRVIWRLVVEGGKWRPVALTATTRPSAKPAAKCPDPEPPATNALDR